MTLRDYKPISGECGSKDNVVESRILKSPFFRRPLLDILDPNNKFADIENSPFERRGK